MDRCNTMYPMLLRRNNLFRADKTETKNINKRLYFTKYRNRLKNKYRQSGIIKCDGDFRKKWVKLDSWFGRHSNSLDSVVIVKHLGKEQSISNICNKFSLTFTDEIRNIKHTCKHMFNLVIPHEV